MSDESLRTLLYTIETHDIESGDQIAWRGYKIRWRVSAICPKSISYGAEATCPT